MRLRSTSGAAFTINLVVEELFTNMVRHNTGGGEVIDLSIERVGDVASPRTGRLRCRSLRSAERPGTADQRRPSASAVPVDSGCTWCRPWSTT